MPIATGNIVKVAFTGYTPDGLEFDRADAARPFMFRVGDGKVLPGFEQAILGKDAGDLVVFTLEPDNAFGPHDPHLLFPIASNEVPPGLAMELGGMYHILTDQGELEVVIRHIEEEYVILDANHPLAGKTLTFEVSVLDVK